uniref:Transcription initiation factor IIE subunit beta n=1 Tax=Panagrolaimus davidi TaxID=227884 RepID=A0A914PGG4_9BILA
MDPKHLQQHAEFLKANARNINTLPNINASTSTNIPLTSSKLKRKAPHQDKLRHMKSLPNFDQHSSGVASTSSSSSSFGMMAKIVDYMKKRHLENQHWSLTLNECLNEMNQTVTKEIEQWLIEKLPECPKLLFNEERKFCYKPPYKIKTDEQIKAQLLKNYCDEKGAILLSELNDCITKADERMSKIGSSCITVPCHYKKKKDKAYFYNDSNIGITVDEEYLILWRTIPVLDEKRIEEYLAENGLTIIKDQAQRRIVHSSNTNRRMQPRRPGKIQNTHMSDILESYETT